MNKIIEARPSNNISTFLLHLIFQKLNWLIAKDAVDLIISIVESSQIFIFPPNISLIHSGHVSGLENLKKVVLPNTVTHIGYKSFNDCCELEEIVIPESVKHIGERAFYNCKKLKSVYLNDNIGYIGPCAFQYCRSLKNIVIPPFIHTLLPYTFHYCQSLEYVYMSCVKHVSQHVFFGCESMKEVIIMDA